MEVKIINSYDYLASKKYEVYKCLEDFSCNNKISFLYFISNGVYIKIGYSSNVLKRIYNMQTGNPNTLIPLAIIPYSKKKIRGLEEKYHLFFNNKKTDANNEWFSLTEDDIYSIRNNVIYLIDFFDGTYRFLNGYTGITYDSEQLLCNIKKDIIQLYNISKFKYSFHNILEDYISFIKKGSQWDLRWAFLIHKAIDYVAMIINTNKEMLDNNPDFYLSDKTDVYDSMEDLRESGAIKNLEFFGLSVKNFFDYIVYILSCEKITCKASIDDSGIMHFECLPGEIVRYFRNTAIPKKYQYLSDNFRLIIWSVIHSHDLKTIHYRWGESLITDKQIA